MSENLFEAPQPESFPPLFTGEAASSGTDPFARACTQAMIGVDAGLLVHRITPDRLAAAIVFAPETPLEEAMVAMIACGLGFQNAMGALAPPEVAVHLGWQGGIYINGGRAGRLRAAAASADPDEVPDWLVIGLELDILPQTEGETGDTPNQTCLTMEGGGDVSPIRLLESWSRHTLVWLNELETDGPRALHAHWRELAMGLGKPVDIGGHTGTFVGIDEAFGLLLKTQSTTRLFPLSSRLETGETP